MELSGDVYTIETGYQEGYVFLRQFYNANKDAAKGLVGL